MASKAWKRLERDIADYFGVKRNIKRGMDFSIEDTDVDVVKRPEWKMNMIIDCKYRSNANMVVPITFRDEAKKCKDKDKIPVLLIHSPRNTYLAIQLEDFTQELLDELVWEKLWISTMSMRSNAEYMDDWFDKLYTTYAPLKAEEFNVDPITICPIVAMRVKGAAPILVIPIAHL